VNRSGAIIHEPDGAVKDRLSFLVDLVGVPLTRRIEEEQIFLEQAEAYIAPP
jgi:hypothetical protein